MPTPSSPTALSQLPAQAIHTHFATRPALYSVVFNALRSRILERYPSLTLDLSAVKLAIPHPDGVYTYRSLMEVAIAHVLNPQLLDLRPKRELPYYLTQQIDQGQLTGGGVIAVQAGQILLQAADQHHEPARQHGRALHQR